jgi:CDP-paratose 2-epimerase
MKNKYLITGGAGFIGSNYVSRLLERGEKVVIFDNLSRKGATQNLKWLREKYDRDAFDLIVGDVRDEKAVQMAVQNKEIIIHLAAQVAVTTSVMNPKHDFEVNALGTLNILEAARLTGCNPSIIYASTNKVYGDMADINVLEGEEGYSYIDLPLGIAENRGLDFYSPYGCSKGCGDQYVRDYARIFNLPTVVMRQSCIFGTRQFGVEDQGWIAWFIIALISGKPITIYGNGKQVRDVLFIDDLLDAYDAALKYIHVARGQVYNIGGGPKNKLAIWKQFGPILERLMTQQIEVNWGNWRPGDQRIYVSDIRKAKNDFGWEPKIGLENGIEVLFNWVKENQNLFI